MIENIYKPALSALWPSKKSMNVVLDLGANIDCNSKNLIDFSIMGSALLKALFDNINAKVALLNIGSEELKGNETIKETFQILNEKNSNNYNFAGYIEGNHLMDGDVNVIVSDGFTGNVALKTAEGTANFITSELKKTYTRLKDLNSEDNFIFNGYIEGNRLMNGDTNVIVTDGFTGNVALKTAEGTAKFITDSLKESLTENFFSKMSIIFSYFSLKKFKSKLDPRKYNGAIFLGLNGPVVKSHGGTDAIGFYYSIDLCYRIIKGNLMDQIKNNLSHLNDKN